MADINVSGDKFFLMLWATCRASSDLRMADHRSRPLWARAKEAVDYDRVEADLARDIPSHAQPKEAKEIEEENFDLIELGKAVSMYPSMMADLPTCRPAERLKYKLKALVRFDRAITKGLCYGSGK